MDGAICSMIVKNKKQSQIQLHYETTDALFSDLFFKNNIVKRELPKKKNCAEIRICILTNPVAGFQSGRHYNLQLSK